MNRYRCTVCTWTGDQVSTTDHKHVEADGTFVRITGALCPKCFKPARINTAPIAEVA